MSKHASEMAFFSFSSNNPKSKFVSAAASFTSAIDFMKIG